MELAARRAIARLEHGEVTPEILEKYTKFDSPEYHAMVASVCKELNLSTLKYQSLDKLIKAIGIDPEHICTYCWTGNDVCYHNGCPCDCQH